MDTQQLPVFELNLHMDPLLPFRHLWDSLSGGCCPQNWHENTELLYCTSGEGFVTYNDRRIPIREGQLVVVNSEMFHSILSDGEISYHCMILDRRFCRDSGIPTTQLYFQEQIDDPRICGKFLEILEAETQYLKEGSPYLATLVRARTLEFLYLLCRDCLVEENRSHQSSQLVRATMNYVRKNLSKPMTLDEIAVHVGINKYHLSREFKRAAGRTIFDVIVQLRCAAARELIEQGSSVSQAARACGFENLSYFTRTFKKYYQELPSRYRK